MFRQIDAEYNQILDQRMPGSTPHAIPHKCVSITRVFAKVTRYDNMEEAVQAMAHVQVNASRFTEYLTEVFKPSDSTDAAALIRAESSRDSAEHFFDEGRGNRLPGIRGTLWAACNGVTELRDHRKTRQTPGPPPKKWRGGAQRFCGFRLTRDAVLGFLAYPRALLDVNGRSIVPIPDPEQWTYRGHIKNHDFRLRSIVDCFAEAGYLESVKDEFA